MVRLPLYADHLPLTRSIPYLQRPLSFKEDSVALLDPVLSFYGSAREGSPFKDDASIRDRAPFRQTSQFKHAVSMMDESEMDNDFTLSVQDCQDDSADNVNQGTPTKKGDNSGSSTRSTPSSGARSNLFNPDYTAGTQSSFTGHGYIRGVSDSRVIDYDPYLKAVEEHSYMSDNSGDGLGRNVIKTLDFGDSVEYHHDDLSIISDNDNKTNASGIGSRAVVSPHMSTPPRTAVAAIGHDALGASPPPGLGSRRAPELKPPSASSPASPDIRGNSSFNKTPSRIPMPSSRGAHSGKRVSPTQERSTSQFADALKRHGNDMGVDSEADIVAPLHMSKTVSLLPSRMHLTPQSKVSMGRADATPGTVSGAKPPTPAPTPLQLPPSRFASDAYLAQGVRVDERATQGHQDLNARNVRSDMTAFTEGFDEVIARAGCCNRKLY